MGRRKLYDSIVGGESDAVNYRRETCDCPNFLRRGTVCKHVYAVGIFRAKHRGESL